MRSRDRGANDRGSVTLELTLLTPALLLLLGMVVFAGRVVNARTDVLGAARDAARAVSIDGESVARAVANDSLIQDGYSCDPLLVDPDVRAAQLEPQAEPGLATVQVSCRVSFAELGVPFPGSIAIEQTAREVVDAYRSR